MTTDTSDKNDRLAAARLSAANQWLRDEVARLTAALAELRAAADQADAEYQAEIARLHAVNEQLRLAINRLALQDATLSVCEGNVTVTMDATLTEKERYAVMAGLSSLQQQLWSDPENLGGEYRDLERYAATLRGLLERMK